MTVNISIKTLFVERRFHRSSKWASILQRNEALKVKATAAAGTVVSVYCSPNAQAHYISHYSSCVGEF